ncbi:uncharacterized protein LOC111445430 isoform X2 [Cucurbita moschata]|uniref:Uncharacterized protein LOC111445430 isoform X2 n=1 Tax=Cucurbita moschata TaxID=3662 RepID=A0A6J1FH63_CUCMO|nr:uncharacterized protein LOC111445430 isoform X2 [Cucurbita moschata]
MVMITVRNFRLSAVPISSILPQSGFRSSLISPRNLPFPFVGHRFPSTSNNPLLLHARKKNSESEPVIKRNIVEEVSEDEEDDELLDELEDDEIMDDDGEDYFEEEFMEDNAEVYVGDGGEGGGISLAGTWWDKEALAMAEEVILSFDGDLKIYAFKTVSNSTVQVRIEKLSNKSGSPRMEDIEAFSSRYRARLDEAELSKTVPENISLEVSSPGVERVVRIPDELDRFKERAMYVKYTNDVVTPSSSSESDGIFKLVSFNIETRCCVWGLADVRINREKAGKGRPLSKKQREWRLETPFDSLRLVRLYSDY